MIRKLALLFAFIAFAVPPSFGGWTINSYRFAAAPGNITIVDAAEVATAIDGGDVTVPLSNITGLAENDVVFVLCGTPRTAVGTGTSSSGWTSISGPSDNSVIRSQIHRKVMSSSPDTSIVCTGSANAADASIGVAIALRGVNTATPEDATVTVKADTASSNPDAVSITTVTNNAWVLDFAVSNVNDATITVPSGYGNLGTNTASDTRSITGAVATITKATAGAEDPPAYTNWTSARWNTHTVAVRPQ